MNKAALEIFDEEGFMLFDSTTSTTRIVGKGTTGTTSGSLIDTNIGTKDVWVLITSVSGGRQGLAPTFSYEENKVVWNFTGWGGRGNNSCTFIYGVF